MSDNIFQGLDDKRKRRKAPRETKSAAEQNAVLRKVIGERFRNARNINGWGQWESAEMFGYKNSTQLSLIEDGKRMPPYSILLTALKVYGVSIDYLMGVSDEPERDPKMAERQAAMAQVTRMLTENATLITTQFQRYMSNGAPSVVSSRHLLAQADECTAAIQRLYDMNKEQFEGELKGAATVLRTMEALVAAVRDARGMLARHDRVGDDIMRTAELRAGATYPLLDHAGV